MPTPSTPTGHRLAPLQAARSSLIKRPVPGGLRYLPAVVTLLAGIALAIAVFAAWQKEEGEHKALEFARIAEDAEAAIKEFIDRGLNALRALTVLYPGASEIGQEDFAILARLFLTRNPSIQALAWAPRMPQEERGLFEARMHKNWPGFQITEQAQADQVVPASERATYYPILFVEPFKDNGFTLGLDIAYGQHYTEAAKRAQDTGDSAAASDHTRLYVNSVADPVAVVLHPVYSKGVRTETVAQQRENLGGFVVGRTRIAGVLEQSADDLSRKGIGLSLYEFQDEIPAQLLYSWQASRYAQRAGYGVLPEKERLFSRVLDVADRHWQLDLAPAPSIYSGAVSQAFFVLAACLLFTVLVAAYMSVLTTRHARTRRMVRRLETELTHVSRLMTLGELAPTLAHEINQPLATISNYVQVCLHQMVQAGVPSDLSDMLREIGKQAERASQIVEHIRNLARREAPERVEVNLNAAIREVLQLLHTEIIRQGVRVESLLDEAVPPVQANRVQVEQVILNLVRNASEAMSANTGQERILTVHTRPFQTRADTVEVVICDTGPGVPERIRNRLFESFYTTKPGGMGMGLSISRSIIQAHGGAIWMRSAAKRGTCFHFTLPAPVPAKTESKG